MSLVRSYRIACRSQSMWHDVATLSSCTRRISTANGGPLAGIRVVDFTRILAGPWCTMLLGDMGADVVKVENVDKGDDTRAWGPPFVEKQSAYFLCCNRNKRSLALNIKSEAGRRIVHALVEKADVFVENFLPGKLDKLGYGYETLRKINPKLVYASISGYGATGPQAQRTAYDVAIAAQGGLMSITGPEGGEPVKVGVAVTDLTTGLYMHGAIIAALFARQRTGVGQKLDTSLLECQIANLANIASNVLVAGWPTKRWGTAHESIAPYQAFDARDGQLIVAAMNDAQFKKLCVAIERPDLLNDERYGTNAGRVANRSLLIPDLQRTFSTRNRDDWLHVLTPAGVTAAPINSVQEALADPQVLHRDMIREVKHDDFVDPIKLVGIPVKYSDTAATAAIRLPPPLLGEHTQSILAGDLGLSESEISQLARERVIRFKKATSLKSALKDICAQRCTATNAAKSDTI